MGNFLSRATEWEPPPAPSSGYRLHKHGRPRTSDFRVFFEKDGIPISPFHDIPLYADEEKHIFNMVVEIPRWTNAKYEVSICYTPSGRSRYSHTSCRYRDQTCSIQFIKMGRRLLAGHDTFETDSHITDTSGTTGPFHRYAVYLIIRPSFPACLERNKRVLLTL